MATLTNERTTSQCDQIAAWLKSGNEITPIDALNLCGCFRLGARIADLKKRGMHIVTRLVTEDGKRFASYKLVTAE